MKHPIYRVTSVENCAPYTLNLGFNDGLTRTIDCQPILQGGLFGPLRNATLFAQFSIDPEVHTVLSPCGADFNPAALDDWPEHEAGFRAAAKRWKQSTNSLVENGVETGA